MLVLNLIHFSKRGPWWQSIKWHQFPELKNISRLVMQLSVQSIEARLYVENEDVVGAAPTGGAPTTSEWSTILLPTKVNLILEVWRYAPVNKAIIGTDNGLSSQYTIILFDIIITIYINTVWSRNISWYNKYMYCQWVIWFDQSGTKPNLVDKIFSKICLVWV